MGTKLQESPLEVDVKRLARGDSSSRSLKGLNVTFIGEVTSVAREPNGGYSAVVNDASDGSPREAICLYTDQEYKDYMGKLREQGGLAVIELVGRVDTNDQILPSLEDGKHIAKYVQVRGEVLGDRAPYAVRPHFVKVMDKGWL